jgi:glycine/D-amino acid oxidase-like deaminating enzyme
MLSFWEKDVFLKKYDVIIIGAGFSGLWLAYFLKKYQPKIEIAILEAGILPTGASTKNAGFSCFGSPSELLENIEVMGINQAMFWSEKRYKGINMIRQCFGSEVEFDDCGGTELFNDKILFEETKDQLSSLNHSIKSIVGNDNHFYLDDNIIQNAGFSGFQYAIKNSVEGSIHSGKLINIMTETLHAMKVRIFNGVKVQRFDNELDSVKVYAENGLIFEARHLSITTNAFTKQLLPEVDLYPGRGQVLITEPIEGLNWRGTFHFDKGYYYFRNYRNRVLFGGGRNLDFKAENTDEFALTELVQSKLEQLLYENIIPEHKNIRIDHRWSGIMAFDETKTPLSKCLNNRLSISVRMNGMGVALAPSLSESLANEILTIL